MVWKLLVPVCALMLAIGWLFSPGTPLAPAPVGEPSEFVLTKDQLAKSVPAGSYNAVELDRQSDGHFYAEADVDGGTIRFLVDTGATMVALSATDAESIGLQWNDEELQHVGRGVSGDVMGKPVMLKNVALGDLQAQNVQAVIIPHGLDRSLLGQSFLSRVDSVNIEGDRMTLN
jgi:aspartyl protease family protein